MYDDLKENIILVMQHPIARRPISNLSDEEREKAFDLLNYLSTLSVDENYTLLDYIQMARLEYALGELEYKTTNDTEKVIRHFRTALQHLEKGGFDLSISKWTELVIENKAKKIACASSPFVLSSKRMPSPHLIPQYLDRHPLLLSFCQIFFT